MKIIFLTHKSDQGHRFRVEQYFPFLRMNNIEPLWQPLPDSIMKRFSIYKKLKDFDFVCFQRRLISPFEFFWVRRKSRRIIFDLDDAVMYRSSSSKNPHSFSRLIKFKYMIKGSDVVITGNQFLKKEVLKIDPGKKVFTIPTPIDINLYPKKKEVYDTSEVILGWIGTKGNLRYLEYLDHVFKILSNRFSNLKVKVVSNGIFESKFIPIINKPWKLEEENDDLISFDIGLMPLNNDLWSRGKCGLKIVQYLSVGLPVVCTPVGINQDIIKHGENGFWATDEKEWIEHLSILIENPELRKKMGIQGIKTVQDGYSLEVNSKKYLQILKTLYEEKKS